MSMQDKQPYIFKRQLMIDGVMLMCAIASEKYSLNNIFFRSLVIVFLGITFMPYILKSIKKLYWVHVFLYYCPMIIWCIKLPYKTTYETNTWIWVIVGTLLILLVLFLQRKELKQSLGNFSSNIPISKNVFLNEFIEKGTAIVVEEFYFRGFIINVLKQYGLLSVLIASVIFTLAHYANRWANRMFKLESYLYIFIVGIIIGYIYYKTNSVALCISLHLLYNGVDIFILIKRLFIKEEGLFNDY